MNRIWMIAEDNPAIRKMLNLILELWDVDALMFEDGNQAWRWLDQMEQSGCKDVLPEVALLDIKMPGHQGHEIAQRMRSIAATSRIPVILMTAYNLCKAEIAEIEDTAHPNMIIMKPLPPLDEFRDLIEQTIEASRHENLTAAAAQFAANDLIIIKTQH